MGTKSIQHKKVVPSKLSKTIFCEVQSVRRQQCSGESQCHASQAQLLTEDEEKTYSIQSDQAPATCQDNDNGNAVFTQPLSLSAQCKLFQVQGQ